MVNNYYKNIQNIMRSSGRPLEININPEYIRQGIKNLADQKTRDAIQKVINQKKVELANSIKQVNAQRQAISSKIDNALKEQYYKNYAKDSGYSKMLRDTAPKARKSTQDIMKQIMTELNKLESSGKSVVKDISANYKTQMTPTQAENILKETIGEVKAKVPGVATKSLPIAKQAVQYLPFASSLYDIGRGGYQAFHGHPYAGTAQAGLGTLGLLADMYTGGKGGSALKPIVNTLGKRLAPSMSKWTTRIGIPTVAEFFYGDNKQQEEQPVDNIDLQSALVQNTQEAPKVQPIATGNINYQQPSYTTPTDSVSNLIAKEIANGGGYNQSIEQQPVSQQQAYNNTQDYVNEDTQPQVQQERMDYSKALLDAITRQEQYNSQQYLNSLDTYRRQLPWAKSADFFSRLAGAGYAKALNNPYLANLGPIGAEDLATAYPNTSKQRSDIMNSLLNAQIGRYANMQAASDAGLNPLTGLSDKSVLQQVGGIMKANTAADTKKYSTDKYFEGRQLAAQTQLQIQQMKNAIQEKLLDRTLSTKERMQLRDLQTKLSIAEQRNATNLELGRMGAMSRPYTMGIGLTPEYGKLFGVNYGTNISPDVGGIDPNVINSLINR